MAGAMKPVILELVELENPPYVYVEDTVNLDEDGEGILYSIKEFAEEILKGKTVSTVASHLLDYLRSGDMDQEREPKHLARAYNIAHGLENG